jgi:5-methylcytosine-specific restriction protein A
MILQKITKKIRQLKDPGSHGEKRSKEWPRVRKQHLNDYPKCEVCGGTKKVEVHHIKPFHIYQTLELDPKNLMSLCEGNKVIKCHICVGHTGNYRQSNTNVERDAQYVKAMLQRAE